MIQLCDVGVYTQKILYLNIYTWIHVYCYVIYNSQKMVSRFLLTDEEIMQTWYIYTMEFYLFIKKK